MSLAVKSYDRRSAARRRPRWAYFRNPDFLNFSDLGGDCTNFASQCIYAGSGVMNFTPTYGWYYLTSSNRTASWTGVHYLYQFLTSNQGVGPYATETGLLQMRPGDIIQLALDEDRFQHSPVVVEIRGLIPTPGTIYVAAHSYDADCRPLSSYPYRDIRCLHIEGVRYNSGGSR